MKSLAEIKKIVEDLELDFNLVTINNDGSIDYDGDVYIANLSLEKIPLQFNIVNGNFNCSLNELTSLKYVPKQVKGFNCSDNKLTSLKYAPKECEYFYCWDNKLTSLKYAPEKCNVFDCDNNNLNTLEDAPEKCNDFIFDKWDAIKKVTFKEPTYILKLLKQKRIDLFD